MNTPKLARLSVTFLALVALLGCANHPASTQTLQDHTPKWMKYKVTGSRIARRIDARGRPVTADWVQSTSPQGLAVLPGVTLNTRGF